MNKLKAGITRITDCLMNPKVLLSLALAFAIGPVVFFLLSLSYEELPAWSMAMAGGCLAAAVVLPTMKRANAAENANIQRTFSDAITHLGHESESVILGGIHSLLDLAKENEDYRLKVFNILCTHIKTTKTEGEYQKKHQEKPSTTIQTLLDLLFKSKEYSFFTVDPAKYRADLSGAYLAGSNLYGARLQGINLAEAQLQDAYLGGALLQGAHLWEAQLQKADLRGTQLQGAFLMKAQLHGANLTEANLQETDLTRAQLPGAFLIKTKLRGARLMQTEMQGAYIDQKTELPREMDMGGCRLGGVSPVMKLPFSKFQERIGSRIGKNADLEGAVFDKVKDPFLDASQGNCPAIKHPYTEEDADRWIKEYEKALPWKKHQD